MSPPSQHLIIERRTSQIQEQRYERARGLIYHAGEHEAVAVYPGKPGSIHLRHVAKPTLDAAANGRGVLVKVLRVGVDGTDKEIISGLYGKPPPGDDYLIIGHESFGVVEEVGHNVHELRAGDYVVATVRRPGQSIYDRIGMYDMTTDDEYRERGINLLHGYCRRILCR